jgi:hypothetical protein
MSDPVLVDPAALPAPETLFASALFLMTNHARTRCPLLTRMIAQQLLHLANHPSERVTPQLRAVCEKLAGQWGDVHALAQQARHPALPDVAPLLH